MGESNQPGSASKLNPKAFIGLGIEIVVPVVLFMYAGYRLDGWFGTTPWSFVVGALVGAAVAFYSFYKRVMPSRKDPEG